MLYTPFFFFCCYSLLFFAIVFTSKYLLVVGKDAFFENYSEQQSLAVCFSELPFLFSDLKVASFVYCVQPRNWISSYVVLLSCYWLRPQISNSEWMQASWSFYLLQSGLYRVLAEQQPCHSALSVHQELEVWECSFILFKSQLCFPCCSRTEIEKDLTVFNCPSFCDGGLYICSCSFVQKVLSSYWVWWYRSEEGGKIWPFCCELFVIIFQRTICM